MKTFRTVGSGSTQTIEPIENNKIPVYETKTAAENDLANLEVGQIIATKDEGSELSNPVDVVQDGNMHAVTSNAVADSISDIHPTIDVSKVFSNAVLDVKTLSNTYGNGRYIFVGQGSTGLLSVTFDIWTAIVSGSKSYIVEAKYSNGTSGIAYRSLLDSPTFQLNPEYATICNGISKVCSIV